MKAEHTDSRLLDHLWRHYRIAADLVPVLQGRAANFLVCGQNARWLLKVYQHGYDLARVERSASFVAHLARAGYPTREFVATVEGRTATCVGDRVAALIPWLDGTTPSPNSIASEPMLRQLGLLCGDLHRLGALYRGSRTSESAGSGATLEEKRKRLLRLKRSSAAEVVRQIDVRLGVLQRWGSELAGSRARAATGMIHGDFSGQHVVFRDEHALGVIDVTGEMYLPGWELMRALFQSIPIGHDGPDTLQAAATSFLSGYASHCRLRAENVRLAYDVYLLQLVTSTYGLSRTDDQPLKEFGRWRTRTAAYLSDHRTVLRQLLAELVPN